jgi:hypothetical protein
MTTLTGLQALLLDFRVCNQLPEKLRGVFQSRDAFLEAVGYGLKSIPSLSPGELDFSALGTSRTPIVGAENRGITLGQLQQLLDFLSAHANQEGWLNGWIDLAPPQYSQTSGHRLNMHSINLYQVDSWIIRPSSAPHKCSYVELVCPSWVEEQQPTWFCSQYQAQPLLLCA